MKLNKAGVRAECVTCDVDARTRRKTGAQHLIVVPTRVCGIIPLQLTSTLSGNRGVG